MRDVEAEDLSRDNRGDSIMCLYGVYISGLDDCTMLPDGIKTSWMDVPRGVRPET